MTELMNESSKNAFPFFSASSSSEGTIELAKNIPTQCNEIIGVGDNRREE